MQTITTKYHEPTFTKESRISATASGCRTRIYRYRYGDQSILDDHKSTVRLLCQKLGWAGTLQGGDTKEGMVWVFIDNSTQIKV